METFSRTLNRLLHVMEGVFILLCLYIATGNAFYSQLTVDTFLMFLILLPAPVAFRYLLNFILKPILDKGRVEGVEMSNSIVTYLWKKLAELYKNGIGDKTKEMAGNAFSYLFVITLLIGCVVVTVDFVTSISAEWIFETSKTIIKACAPHIG